MELLTNDLILRPVSESDIEEIARKGNVPKREVLQIQYTEA